MATRALRAMRGGTLQRVVACRQASSTAKVAPPHPYRVLFPPKPEPSSRVSRAAAATSWPHGC